MGQTSSQPLQRSPSPRPPSPTRPSQASPVHPSFPRYSPTMDDVRASEQLLEEGAVTENPPNDNGNDQSPMLEDETARNHDEEDQIDLTTQSDASSSQQTLPSTPPSPSPSTSDETASRLGGRIEVPDSQPASAPKDLAITPSAASSLDVPATMQESQTQTQGKKRKKTPRPEAGKSKAVPSQDTLSNGHEYIVANFAEMSPASAAQANRRRKKSYATPPSTKISSNRATDLSVQEMRDFLPSADVTSSAEKVASPCGLSRQSTSGSLSQRLRASKRTEPVPNGAIFVSEPWKGKRMKNKLQILRKSKPLMPITPFEDSSDDEAHNNTKVIETSRMSAKRVDRWKAIGKDFSDDEASVRIRPQAPTDALLQDAVSDQDNTRDDSPSEDVIPEAAEHATAEPIEPSHDDTRESDEDDTIMAADKELCNVRNLHFPLDLRVSGPFSDDEQEIIRRTIQDYQQTKGVETEELVDVIQWNDPSLEHGSRRLRSDRGPDVVEDEEWSREFWEVISNTQLKRKPEIVKRYIQSRYHACKSGGWSQDEDEKLLELHEEHQGQWKEISKQMNRKPQDVRNRWIAWVTQGEDRNTKPWTDDEQNLLRSAIHIQMQLEENRRDAEGLEALARYENDDLDWDPVCRLLKRNRLQCQKTWNTMKRITASANIRPVYERGRTPEPIPEVVAVPEKKPKRQRNIVGKIGRPRKSAAKIAADLEKKNKILEARIAAGEDVSVPRKRGRPRKIVTEQTKRGRPRKSEAELVTGHGDSPENQDAKASGNESDDSMTKEALKKSRSSRKSIKKATYAEIEGAFEEDLVSLVDDVEHEDGAHETDEAGTEDASATVDADDTVISNQDTEHEKSVSEEVVPVLEEGSELNIPTHEEDYDSEAATSEADSDQEEIATEERSEVDATLENDNDQDEVAAEEHSDVDDDLPEDALPEDDNDQEEAAMEERSDVDDAPPVDDNGQEEVATEERSVVDAAISEDDNDQDEVVTDGSNVDDASREDDNGQEEPASCEDDVAELSLTPHQERALTTPLLSGGPKLQTLQQNRQTAQSRLDATAMDLNVKIEMVATIMEGEYSGEHEIEWHEVVYRLKNKWSAIELRTAYEELVEAIPGANNFTQRVTKVWYHLHAQVQRQAKKQGNSVKAGPLENGEMNRTELLERTPDRGRASKSNTKKKRKRDARDRSADSRGPRQRKKKKKRKSTSTPMSMATPKSMTKPKAIAQFTAFHHRG